MKQTHTTKKSTRLLSVLLVAVLLCAVLSSCAVLGPTGSKGDTTTQGTSQDTKSGESMYNVNITIQQQSASQSTDSTPGTYVYVAQKALDSVVSITTEATVYNRFFGNTVESGAGSGVILCSDDTYTYIVTNNHVVEGYSTIKVFTTEQDCEGYTATVMGTDWQSDIAVVRIEKTGLKAAEVGKSSELVVGQEVAAIGNPLGVLGGTITDGIIGCLARRITVEGVTMTLVQHSAGVSPGNSGGGLFNLSGQLIGIVNAKSSGNGVESIGYAIPVDLALDRAVQIIRQGYVSDTPYIGITYSSSSVQGGGLLVSGYLYNEELQSRGEDEINAGDILLSLGGAEITSYKDVRTVLSTAKVGDVLEAKLYRVKYINPFSYSRQEYTVHLTVHEYTPSVGGQTE